MKLVKNRYFLLFAVSFAVFSLASWERFPKPSRHFHFIDLANSFLNLRLDTDTPRLSKFSAQKEDAARGLAGAVRRHLTEKDGKDVGWNDWASFRIIKLKDGGTVKGIYPWGGSGSSDRFIFRTFENTEMVIDPDFDIAGFCGESGGKQCDETKYYVSFPPFPALLMMPLFPFLGYNLNDVIFTIIFASLNTILLFFLLERLSRDGVTSRTRNENILLSLLFSFGTVNFFSAVRGEVWFTALIIGITLNILYIFFATGARRPLLAGLFLAFGFATRTTLAFTAIFFAMELLCANVSIREKFRKGVLFAAPILAAGAILMIFNHARFDNPFEFGHTYLMEGRRGSIRDFGLFHPEFLKYNVKAAFLNLPGISLEEPFLRISRHGLSFVFCTLPLLFVLAPKRLNSFYLRLAVTAVAVAIPLLLYQNTGWAQFGYRFSLDFMPYLFVMLAVSGRKFGRVFILLAGVAFAVNLFGAVAYDRFDQFFYD
ncbi:MAG: hypothetical protein FJ088_07640 [Deltaproteobacteria bacterium]|nr:hypothetical protein [Deltaproteobacteria bacterium]